VPRRPAGHHCRHFNIRRGVAQGVELLGVEHHKGIRLTSGWGEGDSPMSDDHVKYDSQLVQKFADRLYAEANRLVIHSTVVATMVGTIAGYVIAAVTHVQTIGFVLVCAVVAGGMGYVRGREKAFTLKMQAQQALCLMYTERNTRFVAVSVSQRSHAPSQHSDRPAEQGAAS